MGFLTEIETLFKGPLRSPENAWRERCAAQSATPTRLFSRARRASNKPATADPNPANHSQMYELVVHMTHL